uniref:Uncharacterized protein n=1 Tax=Strombidium rassoulzadegani TaxID=1082188 RepID=A0A7S3FXQ4_9SPIT
MLLLDGLHAEGTPLLDVLTLLGDPLVDALLTEFVLALEHNIDPFEEADGAFSELALLNTIPLPSLFVLPHERSAIIELFGQAVHDWNNLLELAVKIVELNQTHHFLHIEPL